VLAEFGGRGVLGPLSRIGKRVDKKYLFSIIGGLVPSGLAVALIFPLAIVKLTTSLLIFSLVPLIFIVFRLGKAREAVAQIALTPLSPFIAALLVVSFFQDSLAQAFSLLALVAGFVWARLMRLTLTARPLLIGIAGSALLVGSLYLAGISEAGQFLKLQLYFTSFGGKQSAGWAVAFGIVALLALLVQNIDESGWIKTSVVVLGAVELLMLFFMDSVSALIAALGVIFLFALLLLVDSSGKAQSWSLSRPTGFVGLFIATAGGALLWTANFAISDPSSLNSLRRDYSSFTGRDVIWGCYREAVTSGATDIWPEVEGCVSWPVSDLHNIFLQTHFIGGLLLAVLLALGLLTMLVNGFIGFRSSTSSYQAAWAFFSVGTASVALLVGTMEAFLYYPIGFGAIVLFLGSDSMASNWVSRKLDRVYTQGVLTYQSWS
jgi:hypothetical protein